MNPESKNDGKNVVTIPIWNASNCDLVTAESRIPQKNAPERKMQLVTQSSKRLPRKGTSKMKMPVNTESSVSIAPTTKKAAILPSTSSAGRTGVESNCSMVPISHSRAM